MSVKLQREAAAKRVTFMNAAALSSYQFAKQLGDVLFNSWRFDPVEI